MNTLPQRLSLVAQVVDALRQQFQAGQWPEFLPGERVLADQLQVSRSTLRAALKTLRREKWIETRDGRHRVAPRSRCKPVRAVRSRIIGYVTTQPLHEAPHNTLFTMDELRRHLHDAGFALEIHADVRLRSPYAPRLLEQSVRQTQAACWIVSYSPAPVQRWFAERGAPAVVMGSRHEGVELPAIDFDHEAICHHAGGQFARLGHERVAFLRPEVGGAGALASDRGFLDGFRAARPTAPSPQILRYGAGVPSMQTALDELFRPTTAPTGLFVHRALDALTVVSYLGHRGLRIPKDVSLVLGQHDPIVDCLIPSIASYRGDIRKYAARLSRMVLQLARTGESPTRQVFLLAEFKPGESLGPRSR